MLYINSLNTDSTTLKNIESKNFEILLKKERFDKNKKKLLFSALVVLRRC